MPPGASLRRNNRDLDPTIGIRTLRAASPTDRGQLGFRPRTLFALSYLGSTHARAPPSSGSQQNPPRQPHPNHPRSASPQTQSDRRNVCTGPRYSRFRLALHNSSIGGAFWVIGREKMHPFSALHSRQFPGWACCYSARKDNSYPSLLGRPIITAIAILLTSLVGRSKPRRILRV